MADISSAIKQIKGGGDSHHAQAMKKALGAKTAETQEVDKRGGRGTIEPTQTARSLGMPSAAKKRPPQQAGGDWSRNGGTMSVGAPVYIKVRGTKHD
jgi:hypothetical protein